MLASVSERRARNRREMVEAIIAAARAQMRESGVAALNLHEVARRIGTSTAALYKYFPGKAALYDALFRLGTRLYREELEALDLATGSAESALQGAIEHQMDFALRNPELYQLILQRPVPGFIPSEEGLREAAELEQVGGEIMGRLIERGLIAPEAPERAFNLLLAVMGGLADGHLANEPHLPVGQGRFGSLVPDAVRMFTAAWAPARGKKRARQPEREAGA